MVVSLSIHHEVGFLEFGNCGDRGAVSYYWTVAYIFAGTNSDEQ
jgi:hypothetical protein